MKDRDRYQTARKGVLEWFDALVTWMKAPNVPFSTREDWFSELSPGGLTLEVLTDASNELAVTALVAAHLRRVGGKHFDELGPGMFWVRSEWFKWDISFGWAVDRFADWDEAWKSEPRLGEIGYVEVKVLYGHYSPAKRMAVLSGLEEQLKDRRKKLQDWRRDQAWIDERLFAGLIFVVQDVTSQPPVWKDAELLRRVPWLTEVKWKEVATMEKAALEAIWPRSDLTGVTLSIGLVVEDPAR